MYNIVSCARNTRTRKKPTAFTVGFQSVIKIERGLFSVRFLKGSNASCANVTVRFFTVFNVGNLLYVYLERSSGFTVGVAYVVTRRLTFTAYIAYSRHINTSVFGLIFLISNFLFFAQKNTLCQNKHK